MNKFQQLSQVQPLSMNETRAQIASTRLSAAALLTQTTFRRMIGKPARKKNCLCLVKISDPLRVKWDLFVMFLAIYNSFSIPFVATFSPEQESVAVFAIDASIDVFFLLDIIFNFRTTYINVKTGEEMSNGWLIAKNYVFGGRFFIDFLATIPFDIIGALWNMNPDILELFSLLKLVRILRLSKIISVMRAKKDVKLMIRFLQFILFLLMYLNIIACSWHLVVHQNRVWYPAYPFVFDYYNAGVWDQYSYAFYFSVGLLVGSEISPQTLEEVVHCSVIILLGAIITAVMFGEVAVIMANLNSSSTRFGEIMDQVSTTMKSLRLPQSLKYQILDYLASSQATLNQQEEYQKFKGKLPPSYKVEVNRFLFSTVLQHTPVFSSYKETTRELINCTQNFFFKTDELIIEQGQESDGIYFLLSGVVQVLVEDLNRDCAIHRLLKCGEMFGEIGVIFNCRRTAGIRVAEYATVAKVGSRDFLDFLEKYPNVMEELKLRAASVYNDKLTSSLDRVLKRMHYTSNINHLQYIHLLHSFQWENYRKGAVVLEVGTFANKVLFLVEGTVTVHFRSYGKDSHYLIRTLEKEEERLFRANTMTNIPIPARHNISSVFDLYICQLSGPSILCARQALIKGPVPVRITTNSYCKFLVLYTDDIENIARNITGNLQTNITILRNRHCENNPMNDEIFKKPPILDFLQLKQTKLEQFKKKIRIKFKQAVLHIIVKSRQRKCTGVISIHALVKRLVNIARSEGLSWEALDQKIDSRTFPPETIEVTKILNSNESKKPMVKQLATISQEVQGFAWRTESKLRNLQSTLDQFSDEDEQIFEEIQNIQEVYSLLAKIMP